MTQTSGNKNTNIFQQNMVSFSFSKLFKKIFFLQIFSQKGQQYLNYEPNNNFKVGITGWLHCTDLLPYDSNLNFLICGYDISTSGIILRIRHFNLNTQKSATKYFLKRIMNNSVQVCSMVHRNTSLFTIDNKIGENARYKK